MTPFPCRFVIENEEINCWLLPPRGKIRERTAGTCAIKKLGFYLREQGRGQRAEGR